MTLLAGDLFTAQRANRLQQKTYWKQATGTLAASSTDADVPGASITFTTETNGAVVDCSWSTDFDLTGATTNLGSSRLLLDGVTYSDTLGVFQAAATTDRGTVIATQQFTIPTAGSHTIKIRGTTPASMIINLYTTLSLAVTEVV